MEWITIDLPSLVVGFILLMFLESISNVVTFLVDKAFDKLSLNK